MMKTRWNACHALMNSLQNPVISPLDADWSPLLFETLTSVIVHCKNFKVRINATLALSQPSSRACYGAHFTKVWTTVVILLGDEPSAPGSMAGYTEKLRIQLILLLCHLICFHGDGDRDMMTSSLSRLSAPSIAQCSDSSTSDKLTENEVTLVTHARAVVKDLQPEFVVAMEMLSPRQLPDDDAAFKTGLITANS